MNIKRTTTFALIVTLLSSGFISCSSSKSEDNNETSEIISESTSEMVSEIPTESESTTITTENVSVSNSEIESALAKAMESFSITKTGIGNIEYSLTDINDDDIPELFIRADYPMGNYAHIYLFDNGSFKDAGIEVDEIKICTAKKLVRCDNFGGGTVHDFYTIENGKLTVIDELYVYAGQYKRLNDEITENEFNTLLANYDSLAWDELAYTAYSNTDSSGNKYGAYSGYQNIENAPTDMIFYEGSNVRSAVIATDSTGLNMRTGPGSDYDKILEIPKGETVSVLGMNNEWCYVKWSVYAAGAMQNIDHYGFISKQFISFDLQSSSQITPDGQNFSIKFTNLPYDCGWYRIDSISYTFEPSGDENITHFTVNGTKLSESPNGNSDIVLVLWIDKSDGTSYSFIGMRITANVSSGQSFRYSTSEANVNPAYFKSGSYNIWLEDYST